MKCASKSKNNNNDENKKQQTQSQSQAQSRTQPELIYEKSTTTLNKNFYKKLIIIVILDYISRSSYWISYSISKVEPTKISHTLQRNIQ